MYSRSNLLTHLHRGSRTQKVQLAPLARYWTWIFFSLSHRLLGGGDCCAHGGLGAAAVRIFFRTAASWWCKCILPTSSAGLIISSLAQTRHIYWFIDWWAGGTCAPLWKKHQSPKGAMLSAAQFMASRKVLAADEPLANRSSLHPGRGAAPTSQKQKKEKHRQPSHWRKIARYLSLNVLCY